MRDNLHKDENRDTTCLRVLQGLLATVVSNYAGQAPVSAHAVTLVSWNEPKDGFVCLERLSLLQE